MGSSRARARAATAYPVVGRAAAVVGSLAAADLDSARGTLAGADLTRGSPLPTRRRRTHAPTAAAARLE